MMDQTNTPANTPNGRKRRSRLDSEAQPQGSTEQLATAALKFLQTVDLGSIRQGAWQTELQQCKVLGRTSRQAAKHDAPDESANEWLAQLAANKSSPTDLVMWFHAEGLSANTPFAAILPCHDLRLSRLTATIQAGINGFGYDQFYIQTVPMDAPLREVSRAFVVNPAHELPQEAVSSSGIGSYSYARTTCRSGEEAMKLVEANPTLQHALECTPCFFVNDHTPCASLCLRCMVVEGQCVAAEVVCSDTLAVLFGVESARDGAMGHSAILRSQPPSPSLAKHLPPNCPCDTLAAAMQQFVHLKLRGVLKGCSYDVLLVASLANMDPTNYPDERQASYWPNLERSAAHLAPFPFDVGDVRFYVLNISANDAEGYECFSSQELLAISRYARLRDAANQVVLPPILRFLDGPKGPACGVSLTEMPDGSVPLHKKVETKPHKRHSEIPNPTDDAVLGSTKSEAAREFSHREKNPASRDGRTRRPSIARESSISRPTPLGATHDFHQGSEGSARHHRTPPNTPASASSADGPNPVSRALKLETAALSNGASACNKSSTREVQPPANDAQLSFVTLSEALTDAKCGQSDRSHTSRNLLPSSDSHRSSRLPARLSKSSIHPPASATQCATAVSNDCCESEATTDKLESATRSALPRRRNSQTSTMASSRPPQLSSGMLLDAHRVSLTQSMKVPTGSMTPAGSPLDAAGPSRNLSIASVHGSNSQRPSRSAKSPHVSSAERTVKQKHQDPTMSSTDRSLSSRHPPITTNSSASSGEGPRVVPKSAHTTPENSQRASLNGVKAMKDPQSSHMSSASSSQAPQVASVPDAKQPSALGLQEWAPKSQEPMDPDMSSTRSCDSESKERPQLSSHLVYSPSLASTYSSSNPAAVSAERLSSRHLGVGRTSELSSIASASLAQSTMTTRSSRASSSRYRPKASYAGLRVADPIMQEFLASTTTSRKAQERTTKRSNLCSASGSQASESAFSRCSNDGVPLGGSIARPDPSKAPTLDDDQNSHASYNTEEQESNPSVNNMLKGATCERLLSDMYTSSTHSIPQACMLSSTDEVQKNPSKLPSTTQRSVEIDQRPRSGTASNKTASSHRAHPKDAQYSYPPSTRSNRSEVLPAGIAVRRPLGNTHADTNASSAPPDQETPIESANMSSNHTPRTTALDKLSIYSDAAPPKECCTYSRSDQSDQRSVASPQQISHTTTQQEFFSCYSMDSSNYMDNCPQSIVSPVNGLLNDPPCAYQDGLLAAPMPSSDALLLTEDLDLNNNSPHSCVNTCDAKLQSKGGEPRSAFLDDAPLLRSELGDDCLSVDLPHRLEQMELPKISDEMPSGSCHVGTSAEDCEAESKPERNTERSPRTADIRRAQLLALSAMVTAKMALDLVENSAGSTEA